MQGKVLRNGYTTGSCAAAAARAAVFYLLTGICPQTVVITLPDHETARFAVERVVSQCSCFRVRKNAGDDPDVTDKTYIHASCREMTKAESREVREGRPAGSEKDPLSGKGYLISEDPFIWLDGGPGIGTVTLEGLPCPVGHYAINPSPRREIAAAVLDVFEETGRTADLCITISVPEGETLAQKTFNPKLGITGGISILGTSGIVRPMSEEAVLDTIRMQIHMRAVAGWSCVILTPGNYGEICLEEKLGIPEGTAVQISNFVRDSVLMVRDEGLKKILFAGHTGKLIKAAAGMPNTHSRYGDNRMQTFISLLERVEGMNVNEDRRGPLLTDDLRERIEKANTTDDALTILSGGCGPDAERFINAFLKEMALDVKRQMEDWADGQLRAEVIVFSREGDTGMTDGASDLISSVTDGPDLQRNAVDL